MQEKLHDVMLGVVGASFGAVYFAGEKIKSAVDKHKLNKKIKKAEKPIYVEAVIID